MTIYYDSRTGNVKRFVKKLAEEYVKHLNDLQSLKSGDVENALILGSCEDEIKVSTNDICVNFIKISKDTLAEDDSHLITYTTGFGLVPRVSAAFLENEENFTKIKSVASSGNMNWGKLFAKAAKTISKDYEIPISMQFELSGTEKEASKYLKYVGLIR